MRDRGMLGYYAGFFSRATALILDILIVTTIVFVIYWSVRLPFSFFLNLNVETCSSTSSVVNTDTLTPNWICATANFFITTAAALAAPIYFILFYSSTGQTIGMYIMGIRVVRLDGKHMSLVGSIVRWFGLFVAMLPFGLGFLWVVIDDRRQGWHDKLAHTCVLYAWRAEEDEFVIGRVQRWLSGKRVRRLLERGHPTPLPQLPGVTRLDLMTIAFSEYEQLDNVLDLIRRSIAAGNLHIVNATVLVKGANDSLGVLAASDLAVGSKVNQVADEPLVLPDYELRRIMQNVPAESFVVAVIIEDRYGDALVSVVSREAAVLVRRYDLDDPSSPLKMQRTTAAAA